MQAYLTAQSRVELSGPTDFAPIVRFAARRAASLPDDGSKYSILLIITDGVITDMEAAKEEIVKVSPREIYVVSGAAFRPRLYHCPSSSLAWVTIPSRK